MGLDGVEMIMTTEEAFGISISNEALEKIRTPRDLASYVASQLSVAPSKECLTQKVFYKLRRGFRSQIPALATNIMLDTPLRSFLHKDQWPRVWSAIRDGVGESEWPEKIPWPGIMRDGPKTFRQLIWHLVCELPIPAKLGLEPWTRESINREIRRIVTDQLNIRDFKMADRFVEDLRVT